MSIALYIRLSQADEDYNLGKNESESISNQRMSLHEYLDGILGLSDIDRLEFCDDGFTGTNEKRPSYIEMMDMVQKGDVKAIIVRDFSRFFRDYIEAGNYLECVFPFLGVRFISINDNYDSDDYKGTTGGLEMAMRNIIYASYSKDLSVKVSEAKVHMMKQGKFIGAYAPYGYKKHESIKYKLAIDEEAADVIKYIFKKFIEGKSKGEIVLELNKKGVLTKSQYFKRNNPDSKKFNNVSDKSKWTICAVTQILSNQIVTGAVVSRKRKIIEIGKRKTAAVEPIIVEDMHDAIVSKEDYIKVQEILGKGKKHKQHRIHDYPLKSLLKCGYCQRNMISTKYKAKNKAYRCPNYVRYDKTTCIGAKASELEIERNIYNAINLFVLNLQREIKKQNMSSNTMVTKLSELQMQIEGVKKLKARQYKQYVEGELSKEKFIDLKSKGDIKIEKLENEIEEVRSKKQQGLINEEATKLIDVFLNSENLTNEMVKMFIETIYVYDENRIEIIWKFRDLFKKEEVVTLKSINSNKKSL